MDVERDARPRNGSGHGRRRDERDGYDGARGFDGEHRRRDKRSDRDRDDERRSHKSSRNHERDEEDSADRSKRRRSPRRERSDHDRGQRRNGDGSRDMSSDEAEYSSRRRSKKHRDSRRRSRSPPSRRERNDNKYRSSKRSRSRSRSRSPPPTAPLRSKAPLESQNAAFDKTTAQSGDEPPIPKEKPNFAQTGLLARETNLVKGTNITLKYNEPPEARKPPTSQRWRLYVFKGKDVLDTIEIYERSVWLLGSEERVVDIHTPHPSSSGQHAALQFRWTNKRSNGTEDWEAENLKKGKVRLYLIDLDSANGTTLNGERVEGSRYVELRSGDLMKYGSSEREYVVMLPPKE